MLESRRMAPAQLSQEALAGHLQILGDAVNAVRRQEHKLLQEEGEDLLKGTRTLWLRNPENMKAHASAVRGWID